MAPRSQTCVFVCFFPSYSWELTAKISSADWVYKAIFFYSRLFCILLTKIQYQKRPQRAIRLSTCTANHSRPPSWSLFFPLSSPSLCPRLVARGLRDDVITQPECQQRQNDLSWRDDAITQSSTYSTHPFIYFTLQIE